MLILISLIEIKIIISLTMMSNFIILIIKNLIKWRKYLEKLIILELLIYFIWMQIIIKILVIIKYILILL